jgi:class 3 adenylate cyclase
LSSKERPRGADLHLLACFGYPEANEFDAERAIRAGLALVEAVSGLTAGIAVPLQTRVGIASGLVVIGTVDATVPPLPAANRRNWRRRRFRTRRQTPW